MDLISIKQHARCSSCKTKSRYNAVAVLCHDPLLQMCAVCLRSLAATCTRRNAKERKTVQQRGDRAHVKFHAVGADGEPLCGRACSRTPVTLAAFKQLHPRHQCKHCARRIAPESP